MSTRQFRETNMIDSTAEIAKVEIGHFNVIGKNVIIGNNNIILDGTIIGKESKIEHYFSKGGNRCLLDNLEKQT